MQTVLIVIHLLLVIALVGLILLQRSEGGGLGMGGGGVQGFMTGRGQANALTRATAVLAAGFFLTSLVLSVLGGLNRQPRSILDGAAPPAIPGAPAPAGPPIGGPGGGVLNQLQQSQGGAPAQTPAAPSGSAPAEPAPSGQVPQSR